MPRKKKPLPDHEAQSLEVSVNKNSSTSEEVTSKIDAILARSSDEESEEAPSNGSKKKKKSKKKPKKKEATDEDINSKNPPQIVPESSIEPNEESTSVQSGHDNQESKKEVPPLDDEASVEEENKELPVNSHIIETMREVDEYVHQYKLTIMKIEVSELPSAHRFSKNSPWVKASYGLKNSWVADYQESEFGDKATFSDLQWSFNLEKTEKLRSDLVITVCSKNLIFGRYILTSKEFSQIPETKSGYFEITGDILNDSGQAGYVKMTCLRSLAEPVKVAVPLSKSPSPAKPLEPEIKISKIFVKVMSMAMMDLKSVHFLDPNSPSVSLESGAWVGVSEIRKGAGMAARWNGLNWKFSVDRETGFTVTANSGDKVIGSVNISVDEVVNLESKKPNGALELIKPIMKGPEITGKMKVNFFMQVASNNAFQPLPDGEGVDPIAAHSPGGSPYQNPGSPQRSLGGKSMSESLIGSPIGNLEPVRPILQAPFGVTVTEVTVLDTPRMHLLRANALSVNMACGGWGAATDPNYESGQFAHWKGLNWKFTVTKISLLRTTVWSHGKIVGTSKLDEQELLSMPMGFDRKTEILMKIYNDNKEVTGKVRVTCKYEVMLDSISQTNSKLIEEGKLRASQSLQNLGSPDKDPQGFPGFSRSAQSPTRPVSTNSVDGLGQKNFSPPVELSLPLVAIVKSISLLDLSTGHSFSKNIPRARFICDRKSALTSPDVSAGGVNAKWTDLNWMMKIFSDSYLLLVAMSGKKELGRVEITPESLLDIPYNSNGYTEVNLQLQNGSVSAGKAQIVLRLRNYDPQGSKKIGDDDMTRMSGFPNVAWSPDSPSNRFLPPIGGNGESISMHSGWDPNRSFNTPGLNNPPPTTLSQAWQSPFQNQYSPGGTPGMSEFGFASSTRGYQPASPTLMVGGSERPISPPLMMSQRPISPMIAAIQQMMSQNSQPVFDPTTLNVDTAERMGLNFHFTIHEIDLMQLRPVHKRGALNCPSISAAYGKWNRTTDPIPNAGESGFWTKLGWRITLKGTTNLRIVVSSKSVMIGTVNFDPEDLLKYRQEEDGYKRLNEFLMDGEKVSGRIKVSYSMQISKMTPEELANRVLKDPSLSSRSHSPSKRPTTTPSRPMSGLTSINASMRNSPVGKTQSVGSIRPYSGGENGLAFVNPSSRNSPVGKTQSMGSMRPYSGGENDPFAKSGKALSRRSSAGSFGNRSGVNNFPDTPSALEFVPEIEEPVEVFQVFRKVDFPFKMMVRELSTVDLMKISRIGKNQPCVNLFCDSFFFATETNLNNTDVTYFRDLNWAFPVGSASDPKVVVLSREKTIGTASIDLNQLKNVPVDSDGNREIVVSLLTKSSQTAGKVRLVVYLSPLPPDTDVPMKGRPPAPISFGAPAKPPSPTTLSSPTQVSPFPSRVIEESSGVLPSGRNGTTESVKGVFSSDRGLNTGSTMSQPADGNSSILGTPSNMSSAAYTRNFDYLLQTQANVDVPDEIADALQVTVQGVAVIDLQPAHNFMPNSPCVNLACGKFVVTTEIRENAGKMANWDKLNHVFIFEKTSLLRILLSSREKIIGSTNINRAKLLGGKKSPGDAFVLFSEISQSNGKKAGKIKIIYKLAAAPEQASGKYSSVKLGASKKSSNPDDSGNISEVTGIAMNEPAAPSGALSPVAEGRSGVAGGESAVLPSPKSDTGVPMSIDIPPP